MESVTDNRNVFFWLFSYFVRIFLIKIFFDQKIIFLNFYLAVSDMDDNGQCQ